MNFPNFTNINYHHGILPFKTKCVQCTLEDNLRTQHQFHEVHGFSGQNEQDDVRNDESASAVLVSQEREPPNVAQTNGQTHARQDELRLKKCLMQWKDYWKRLRISTGGCVRPPVGQSEEKCLTQKKGFKMQLRISVRGCVSLWHFFFLNRRSCGL